MKHFSIFHVKADFPRESLWLINHFCVATPSFFSSLKKNTIITPSRERAFGTEVNKKGHQKQITHHCQFEGLYGAWRRHMEGLMSRGTLSLLHSETRWCSLTSPSRLERNKELCKQSEQWGVGAEGPLKTKQPSTEFESGTYIQHTWGAGVGGSSGGE